MRLSMMLEDPGHLDDAFAGYLLRLQAEVQVPAINCKLLWKDGWKWLDIAVTRPAMNTGSFPQSSAVKPTMTSGDIKTTSDGIPLI